MNKPQEWYEKHDWADATQEQRDEWYRQERVICEGNEDNMEDRAGWLKREFDELGCSGSVWLDLACRDGFITRSFLGKDCEVIGVDISDHAIEVASRRARSSHPDAKWQYIQSSFFDLDWPSIHVGYTCCFEFIEHIPRDSVSLLLRLMSDATEHGIFISTPHIDGKYGRDNPDSSHINLYSIEDLETQVQDIVDGETRIRTDGDFIYCRIFPKGSRHVLS